MAQIWVIHWHSLSDDEVKQLELIANQLLESKKLSAVREKVRHFIDFIQQPWRNEWMHFTLSCRDYELIRSKVPKELKRDILKAEKELNPKISEAILNRKLADTLLLERDNHEKIKNEIMRCLHIGANQIEKILNYFLRRKIKTSELTILTQHILATRKEQLILMFKIALQEENPDLKVLWFFLLRYQQIDSTAISIFLKIAFKNISTRYLDVEFLLEHYWEEWITSPWILWEEHMIVIEKIEKRSL